MIYINDLTFKYLDQEIFKNLNMSFQASKRYVVTGLNGTGKSTILKIISGKSLCPFDTVSVLGCDPFRNTSSNMNIAYLSNEWGTKTVAFTGYNMTIQSDIKVKDMMINLKLSYPERNKELIQVLSINPNWNMNAISEGQRKRVQLYLGLIQPFKVCLLDEITTNLDILVKHKFMSYLKKESIENNACILYVTHIFDGLEEWCTDIVYIKKNRDFEMIDYTSMINKNKDLSIYNLLLDKFIKEDGDYEKEDIKPKYKKNAGGYTSGVLIDYQLD